MTFTSNLDEALYQEIWDTSLETVPESKYRKPEAWDLFQCLEWALGIEGDVVEFGTYRGHSGWLIAEFLRWRESDKILWLFDTFDQFPEEQGEDAHWSGTHEVDLAEVEALFEPFDNVRLVQGDFTQTADQIWGAPVFVHVDCDSYRGTRFAAEWAWLRKAAGTVALFQDYGQAQCDGARRAVDEFLDEIGCPHWFSASSGCMIVWM